MLPQSLINRQIPASKDLTMSIRQSGKKECRVTTEECRKRQLCILEKLVTTGNGAVMGQVNGFQEKMGFREEIDYLIPQNPKSVHVAKHIL